MTHLSLRKPLATLLLCLMILCALPAACAGRADLTFSLESGFYEWPMPLEMTCDVPGATIYYTTDGSLPDETDLRYDGPLTLLFTTEKEDPLSRQMGTVIGEEYVVTQDFPSAHVIRAVAIMPEGTRSQVVNGTFFIGYDRKELYGELPIVSLLMEPDHLFDHDTGIYVAGRFYEDWIAEQTEPFESWEGQGNYTQRGKEWERPVAVSFLPAEGEGFEQDMGVRIKGGASRGSKQKSLRLIARADYGEKNVKYPVFPDNLRETDGKLLKKYKSFTLRNGGNDCDFGKIRDPYIQRLAEGLRVETAANRPVIAFINGEFWGLYTLNEEYSDNYFDYHYGINNDNIVTVKNGGIEDGEDSDKPLYEDMYCFIRDHDMRDPAHYAQACELLDMDSFADYLALMLYVYNEDGIFQNNNWQMWRVRQPGEDDSPYADGKWRMMVFDTDFSSGIYADGKNFTEDNLAATLFGEAYSDWHPARMAQSLLRSEDFKQKLVLALCDMRNQYFAKIRANDLLKDMADRYLPCVPDTFRRFGPQWVAQWNPEHHFRNELDQIGVFFRGRYDRFLDMVKRNFALQKPLSVTVKVSDGEKGAVYLNGRNLPITKALNGQYFMEYPITLTAVPNEGYSFVGWDCTSAYANVLDPQAETTQVRFTRSFSIKALFE